MSSTSSIFLIGPMGAGKTSIGKLLANLLGLEFLDADQLITDKLQLSIAEIFQQFGEQYFRSQETVILKTVIQKENIVLATGGGCILSATNRLLLRRAGNICYLKVSVEQQLQRLIADGSRPLLPVQVALWPDYLAASYQHRAPLYEAVADYILDADHESINSLAKQLCKIFTS